MQPKLLGFINVDFNVIDQLLITFVARWVQRDSAWTIYRLQESLWLSKELYKTLTEFIIPMKPVTLIEMCSNKTCSIVRIGKYLSNTFPIQNYLKQKDALSPLLLNFALEYAFKKVREN
jgi:hypothetical protein